MGPSECAKVNYELYGSKSIHLEENVKRLLDFIRARDNPYIIEAPGIKLHNLITKQLADEAVTMRLLHLRENGDRLVKEFRNERSILKNKLSFTIAKRCLPQLDYRPDLAKHASISTTASIGPRMIAATQRDIDISKERGLTVEVINFPERFPHFSNTWLGLVNET